MKTKDDIKWPEVVHKRRFCQIIMCNGKTCGKIEKGALPIPIKKFNNLIKQEKMKSSIKFSVSECLGVCTPHNVLCILTAKEQIWLGMFRNKRNYDLLANWLHDLHKAKKILPLPHELEKHRFDRYHFD